jgi:hypothetical protein
LTSQEIVETYEQAVSFDISLEQVRWFSAFSGYRLGVITCFSRMLHRRGKRGDPHWEDIALSASRMFERGLELVDGRSRRVPN